MLAERNKKYKRIKVIRVEFIKCYRERAEEEVINRIEKYKDKLMIELNKVKIKKQEKPCRS